MTRQRKEKEAKDIKLRQPDRSGPTEKTLFDMADERNLFNLAEQQERKNRQKQTKHGVQDGEEADEGEGDDDDDDMSFAAADRIMDTLLYSVCLAMLHFTLDFLVQHQYAMAIEYKNITGRAFQALMVFAALVHVLHPHPSNTTLVPYAPAKYQSLLRQTIFFATSVTCGCYLIHITDRYAYLAVLKRSPPLGCLWIWSVFEMNLPFAVSSLAATYAFFWQGGYSVR